MLLTIRGGSENLSDHVLSVLANLVLQIVELVVHLSGACGLVITCLAHDFHEVLGGRVRWGSHVRHTLTIHAVSKLLVVALESPGVILRVGSKGSNGLELLIALL